ncbi:MAG: type II toxin-antitoxin system RelB/DinJ family antitoxin [Lachnospiraceae bacterium]|nr:type II toxin-antitoxin system RelB/DinJ family antitoxin [Lachnospiraceae bacterium]
MATTNVTMRMDAKVKSQLQELMSDLGLDLTTYFTMAAKQAIREQRIPFEISRDNFNSETLEAFREVEEMKKNPSMVKSYSCFKDLLKEIEGECIE